MPARYFLNDPPHEPMPITVNSPHSGRPVKVRDQDVGRAIRDEEGRIFYAVPRSDGQGYYGAPTRKGSARDEQRYLEMEEKGQIAREVGRQRSEAQVHDATGRRRGQWRRIVLLAALIVLLAGAAWVAWTVWGRDYFMYGPPAGRGLEGTPPASAPPSGPKGPRLPATPPPQPSGQTGQAGGRGASLFESQRQWGAREAKSGAAPTSRRDGAKAEGVSYHASSALFPKAVSEVFKARPPQAGKGGRRADPSTANKTKASRGGGDHAAASATTGSHPAAGDAISHSYITMASGLKYRILHRGNGRTAVAGKYVLIHYTTMLPDGTVVDSSHSDDPARDQPIGFVLWSGRVIRGWDEGIAGMHVGETRELVVPPSLINDTGPTSTPQIHDPQPQNGAASDHTRAKQEAAAPPRGLRFVITLVDVLPGILHQTLHAGTVGGQVARPGQTIAVHYVGYVNGRKTPFDNSHQRGQPIRFTLGVGDVIRGWDLGIAGMKEGETRTLVIPPYLAYGHRGVPGLIPPDATLRYRIQLVNVMP